MPTEMELTLEQTQQGVSYEVSNIRVISFTMKMEILLEPTSNKLMVDAEFDESNAYVLERFYTSVGNPVKEILFKLNLPDHRILKDRGEDFRYSDIERLSRSDELLKLKNFKKDATLKLSKSTNQEWYENVGPEKQNLPSTHSLSSSCRISKITSILHKSTRPVEDLDLLLWGDLKTMFEPHVEDKVWRNQQEYKVLDWKLYDSCGVHSLRMQHMQIYMLVEKKYPLAPLTLSMMLEKKLIIDYESEMAYQLLKFIIKQLKK
ncbi:hypothetical protein Tco_1339161 [Tanacetum coccineum]